LGSLGVGDKENRCGTPAVARLASLRKRQDDDVLSGQARRSR
jgi:hypothetical protein